MSTFNLKQMREAKAKKETINLDEHITMRLKEQHETAPNTITERQLDENRFEVKEVILERQLDKVRVGSADMITERNLNESKGLFAPLRNEKASKGDINKIEEKRLAGKPNEQEKYEASSQVQKKLKWWDNLKEASTQKTVKTAAIATPERIRQIEEEAALQSRVGPKERGFGKDMSGADSFSRLQEDEEGLVSDSGSTIGESDIGAENKALDKEDYLVPPPAFLKVQNHSLKPKGAVPSINYTLSYNPDDFGGNESAVRAAAMNTIERENPKLAELIDQDSFVVSKKSVGGVGTVYLSFADLDGEYFGIEGKHEDERMFSNLLVEETDVGGTPTVIGRVSLNSDGVIMATEDREEFANRISNYVLAKNPDLARSLPEDGSLADSLDFSALQHGEVTFVLGANSNTGEAATNIIDDEVSLPLETELQGQEEGSASDVDWKEYQEREQNRIKEQEVSSPLRSEREEVKRLREELLRKRKNLAAETDFPIVTAVDIKKK